RGRFNIVSMWFPYPGTSFGDPTQNGRRQSDESEHLGKKTNLPTIPIVARDAPRTDKCCCEWCEEYRKETILGQGLNGIQARHTIKAVSETNRRNENLDSIGRNEPCNR